MSMESTAQFLGIPSGMKKKAPVRRGGGRHKSAAQSVTQQHAAIGAHIKSGNLQGAKSASLMLVKALHSQTGSSRGTPMKPPSSSAPQSPPMTSPNLPTDTDMDGK